MGRIRIWGVGRRIEGLRAQDIIRAGGSTGARPRGFGIWDVDTAFGLHRFRI